MSPPPQHSNALVDILPPEADSSISMLSADDKPDVSVRIVCARMCVYTGESAGVLQVPVPFPM